MVEFIAPNRPKWQKVHDVQGDGARQAQASPNGERVSQIRAVFYDESMRELTGTTWTRTISSSIESANVQNKLRINFLEGTPK
jgi:hypothetical protein